MLWIFANKWEEVFKNLRRLINSQFHRQSRCENFLSISERMKWLCCTYKRRNQQPPAPRQNEESVFKNAPKWSKTWIKYKLVTRICHSRSLIKVGNINLIILLKTTLLKTVHSLSPRFSIEHFTLRCSCYLLQRFSTLWPEKLQVLKVPFWIPDKARIYYTKLYDSSLGRCSNGLIRKL